MNCFSDGRGSGGVSASHAEWMERRQENVALLKYGFQFRKSDVVESVVTSPVEEVIERVREQVPAGGYSSSAGPHQPGR